MSAAEQLEVINRLCPCCGVDPVYEPLGLCCNNMDLADLGAGYVMYFRMIIFFSGIWVFYLVINVIKVAANVKSNYCVSVGSLATTNSKNYTSAGYPACTFDWISSHSVANYGIVEVDNTEKTWVLLFFIAYWVFLSLCKAWLKNTNKAIDINNDTPSDWTLIVRNLPKDEPAEQIKANFEAFGALGREACPVKKVNIAFNCESYVKKLTEVNKDKRLMKLLQVKELPAAKKRMEERLTKGGAKDASASNKTPAIKDFSPEFQKKFEVMKESSTEVGWMLESLTS